MPTWSGTGCEPHAAKLQQNQEVCDGIGWHCHQSCHGELQNLPDFDQSGAKMVHAPRVEKDGMLQWAMEDCPVRSQMRSAVEDRFRFEGSEVIRSVLQATILDASEQMPGL